MSFRNYSFLAFDIIEHIPFLEILKCDHSTHLAVPARNLVIPDFPPLSSKRMTKI